MQSSRITHYILALLAIAVLCFTALVMWLVYEFNHPYICTFDYITPSGEVGESKGCGITNAGKFKYCRITAKRNIKVEEFYENCRRR